MVQVSDWKLKTAMINMLMYKADNMQEHMGNISREAEILRNKRKC